MQGLGQGIGGAIQMNALIGDSIDKGKLRRKLTALGQLDPEYQQSPYAKSQLGLAQTELNSPLSGYGQLKNNILTNESNQQANIARNATDSSQALAASAMATGASNSALAGLADRTAQDHAMKVGNYNNALGVMTQEHQAAFDDAIRRWQDKIGIEMQRGALRSQQWSNMNQSGQVFANAWGGMMGGMGGGK